MPEGGKKMIPRRRVCYKLREATVKETGKKVLVARDAVYECKNKTGTLLRLDKKKIGKARKKALQREKVAKLKKRDTNPLPAVR